MMTVAKMKAASTSEARKSLAAAIDVRDAALKRLAALRAADESIYRRHRDAERAQAAAAKAITVAQTSDARAEIDSEISGEPAPALTLPAAREALAAAERALRIANSARDEVATEISQLEKGAQFREMKVNAAVAAVLREDAAPVIAALVTELDDLQRGLVDKTLALQALVTTGGCATRTEDRTGTAAGIVAGRYDLAPAYWDITVNASVGPTQRAWSQAIAALKMNADAPLP
jgi:hypothetical protein